MSRARGQYAASPFQTARGAKKAANANWRNCKYRTVDNR